MPKTDLVATGHDLSVNRYKEIVQPELTHRPPREILADLAKMEVEIQQGIKKLEEMVR